MRRTVKFSALAVVTLGGELTGTPGPFISFESANLRLDPGSSAVPIRVETSAGRCATAGKVSLRAAMPAHSPRRRRHE